jgi:ABC-type branched-subunit amino acid transport system ATPase component
VVIFDYGEPVCANLIREYAGEPISRLPGLINHAREADIEEEKITEMISLIEKIARKVPAKKLRRFSKKELEIKRALSDAPHLRTLEQLESIIVRKK